MNTTRPLFSCPLLLPLLSFFLLSVPLHAQNSYNWFGNHNERWRDDTNWDPDGSPGAGDTVSFGNDGMVNSINLSDSNGNDKNRVVDTINLSNATSGFNSWEFRSGTLQTSTIHMHLPFTTQNNSEKGLAFTGNLVLPASFTMLVNGDGDSHGTSPTYVNSIRWDMQGGIVGDASAVIQVNFRFLGAARFSVPSNGASSGTFLGTLQVLGGRTDVFDPDFLDNAAGLEVSGTLRQAGGNTVLQIDGGSIVFGNGSSADTFTAPNLSGSDVQESDGTWYFGQIRVRSPDATFEFGDSTSTTYEGLFQGPGTVRKLGTGTFTFGSADRGQAHTPTALLSNKLDSDTTLRPFSGTFEIANGLVQLNNGDELTTPRVQLDADNALETLSDFIKVGALSGSGNLALSGDTLTIGDNSSNTYSGILSGTGDLVINAGSTTQTLTGNNSFSGTVNLMTGTLAVSADTNLGNVANTVAFDGGTLQPTTNTTFTRQINFLLPDSSGSIEVPTGITTTWTGAVTATGGTNTLKKQGGGTLMLNSGSTTFDGDLMVLKGTLGTTSTTGLDAAQVDVVSGGTFAATTNGTQLGSLSGDGAVTVASGVELLVNVNNSSTEFTGTLIGAGKLTKAGTGELAVNLSAASSSRLKVLNGTVSGVSTVGDIEVAAGGQLAPGNGFGTFTGTTCTLDGSYVCEIDDTQNDKLALSSYLSLFGGTGILDLQFPNGPPTKSSYILASYSSVYGAFSEIRNLPAGYNIDYFYNGSNLALVADTTPPTLGSLTRQSPTANPTNTTSVVFSASFSEPVSNVDASDFDLSFPGTYSSVVVSGTRELYTITVSGISGNGVMQISVDPGNDIVDGAGLPLNTTTKTASASIDQTAPTVTQILPGTSITNATTVTYSISFSEAVANFNNSSDLTVTTGGTVTYTGASFSGSGSSYQVTLTGIAGNGTLQVAVNPGSDVQDLAGNALLSSISSTATTIDHTAPAATTITPAVTGPTNTSTLQFSVGFGESVSGFDSFNDLTLTTTGTATATGATFSGTGDSYTVTLTGVAGTGTLGIAVNTGSDVKDAATNALASSVTSAAVTLDNDPPHATSITPATTGPTNANTLNFAIGFDEAVTGFNAFSDLTLITTGSATATGATFGGSGDSYTVTLTGVSGDGTLKLAVNTGSDVTDVPGNPLDTSVTSAAVTIDNTGASATGIVSATTGPTNANTIAFNVTFDEAVTGLDAFTDLVVTRTGSAAATDASFSGSGTSWTVTLTGVSGDGTLKLAIATGGNVLDSLGNPLHNSVISTAVTIDNTGPTASSITPATTGPTNATSVDFAVVFSDAVTGLDSINDLVITTTSTANVGSAAFSGTGVNRTVSLGGITGNGTITLAIKTGGDVADAAGNSLSSSVTSAAVTIDNKGPAITSITPATTGPTNASTISFTVQASEALQGLDSFADLHVETTDSAAVSGANITGSGTSFTVVLTGVAGKGTIALAISTGSDVTDQPGNPLASSVLSAAVSVDRAGPVATSITPDTGSTTNADTIHYTVMMDEPVTGLDSAADLLITADAGVTYTSVAVSGSGDTYTVTVDGVAGDGDLTIAVDPAGDVKDLAGNALTSSALTTITLDNIQPEVLSITPSFIGPLTSDSVDFDVVFSEPVNGFNDASALQISYGGTLRFANILFSGSGTNYAVILSGRTGDGVIDIQVKTNSGVADAAGNAPASSSPSPTVRIIDGPLLNWDLEEGSGTRIWEQTFGTPNVATLQGPATWVPGIAPNASHAISLGVDDPSSYVDAGTVKNDGTYGKDTADYRVLTDQWSITAWVQLAEPQSASSERIIVSSDWDSGNGFTFGLRSGGTLAFDFGSNPVDSGIQLPTGRPFFVAIIADHSTGTFGDGTSRHQFAVWDGRAWQKVNGTDFANIRLQGLELGSFNSGQRQWDGLIDSAAIYDRALTTTDLDNLVAYTPVSQAYTDWAVASGLNPLFKGGPYDDPNSDGKTNLEHFALGTNPLGNGTDEGNVVISVLPDGDTETYLTYTIPVRKGAVFSGVPLTSTPIDGIACILHGSTDLNGSDIPVVERTAVTDTASLPTLGDYDATPGPDYEYRTFRLKSSTGVLQRGFLWIEIDEAP